MTTRKLLIGLAAVVALAMAAHGAYWWIAAGELGAGFAAWADERRAAGWTVAHAAPAIGGYPLRVRATIGAPDVAGPADRPPWRWRGPDLVLALDLWRPREILFSAPGRHLLTAEVRGRAETVEAAAGSLDGRARLGSHGRVESIVVEAATVDATRRGLPGRLRLDRLALTLFVPATPDANPDADPAKPDDAEPDGPFVSLSAVNVVLPDGPRYPLGRAMPLVALEAKLLGDVVLAPSPTETLTRWREAGGTVEIGRLDVVWGKFDLSGDGTVALDRALQPVVAMTARIKGYRETVDALVETGYVKDRDAMVAKLVLGVIAHATPGGAARLTVPVTMQDGVVSAGPARLLRLPAIDWNAVGRAGGR